MTIKIIVVQGLPYIIKHCNCKRYFNTIIETTSQTKPCQPLLV